MSKNSKDMKLKILLPILIVVAILIWIPNLKNTSSTQNVADSKITNNSSFDVNDLRSVMTQNKINSRKPVSVHLGWKRNPFILENWTAEAFKVEQVVSQEPVVQELDQEVVKNNFILNGIFWNPSKPSALINNQVIGVGMQLDVYQITEITQNQVTMKNGDQILKLQLQE